MIDFANLTDEQKTFFNDLWESHERDNAQSNDSTESFNAYIEQRRKQEESQVRAAEVLKTKMV